MNDIIKVMSEVHGRDISMYDLLFLNKTIEKRKSLFSLRNGNDYRVFLEKRPLEAEELFNALNINYSEFFRNPLTWALLGQLVLPSLIGENGERSELRIWSAGCSGGEEPYSMSMVLDDLISGHEKKIRYRIFATDLSESKLTSARKGTYDSRSLQNVNLKYLTAYFSRHGDQYTVTPNIRHAVDFTIHDLLDQHSASPPTSIFGAFNIVCCSNLLYYYNHEIRQFILLKLHRSMAPNGFLVTGEAEREIVLKFGFRPVAPPSAIFQKMK